MSIKSAWNLVRPTPQHPKGHEGGLSHPLPRSAHFHDAVARAHDAMGAVAEAPDEHR